MSTSSKPKSGAPAHQNRFAFRHNKNSKLTKKINATVTTGGICTKCTEKVEWRMNYRKYKPLSAPRSCYICHKRNIKAAYRNLCAECAERKGVCEGCGEEKIVNDGELSTAESAKESEMLNEMLKGLRERDRRTVLRRVEKGESALDVMAEIVGLEIGNEVTDGDAREDGEDAGDGSAEKDGSRPENAKGSR